MRPPFVGFIRKFFLLVLVSALCCSSSTHGSTKSEKTLAIIKPDGLSGNYTDDIKRTILDYGFSIIKEKIVQLDEITVKRFYAEHSSKCFFSSLVKYMTSIRALCGLDTEKNCVHGSDSLKSAQREIPFFFGELSADVIAEHDEL
ncbi:probable nucleoside diphosphate kinase 5 isoform X4 [Gastrolobium bilobum]|uniref:probable nucleoside diphosphate kinase 5 isoform X4 n=1 Tax=Gastrolobium bilobum TaxID=150636 RepID=UPI002AB263C4|nr:probable nucleoside diphosphate kinase 5 isoform X4 [Gastrolobium bilobum]